MSWIFGVLFFFFAFLTLNVATKRPLLGIVPATLGVTCGVLMMMTDSSRSNTNMSAWGVIVSLLILLIWVLGWSRSRNAQRD
jgi:hypothetical protein